MNHMDHAGAAGQATKTSPETKMCDAVLYSLGGGGGGSGGLLLGGPGNDAQASVGALGERLRHGDGGGAADGEGHFDRTK